MLIDPESLGTNLQQLEEIEMASLRMVVQAIYDYRESAEEIFREESDLVADIGEDLTRESLDKMGMSRIDYNRFRFRQRRSSGRNEWEKSRLASTSLSPSI